MRRKNIAFQISGLVMADVFVSGIIGIIFLGVCGPDDRGITITLPPWVYEPKDTIRISSSYILHIDLDEKSQLLISDTTSSISNAESASYNFILKNLLNNDRSYIWIRTSRQTKYRHYLELRDAIKRAERTIANTLSIQYYGVIYSKDLPKLWQKQVGEIMSLCIIEENEIGKPLFELNPYLNCNQMVESK